MFASVIKAKCFVFRNDELKSGIIVFVMLENSLCIDNSYYLLHSNSGIISICWKIGHEKQCGRII